MPDPATQKWHKLGDYSVYLGIDPKMEDVERVAKHAHYLVFVFEPDGVSDGGKGFGMIPMRMGEYSVNQLRQMLRRFRAKPKQALAFLRLYAADLAAVEAGLYTPEAPARYVMLEATGVIPIRQAPV